VFPGEPQSLLVNGKQLNATANGCQYTCPYDVIDVEPSKTYLFRFVGAQGLTYLQYKLAGHNFTIVQVDGGSYTKPLEVDHIEFGTGQRYAALLTTKSVEELNGQTIFWANISSFFRHVVDEGYALLRYTLDNDTTLPPEAFQGVNSSNPNIPQVGFSTFGWIDSQLEPLTADPYPTTVDQRIPTLYTGLSQELF
jgi:L-ascorbate oxidase